MLQEKEKAFAFQLPDKDGIIHSLDEFKGKKVVLYFYPKDNTPGCTKQACAFKAAYEQFRRKDIAVIGISKDSIKSHQNFAKKYDLPFLLLSDPELQAIQGYGVWQQKMLYGKTYMGVTRSTFIIDEHGVILKVFEKATPATNAEDILKYLADL